MLPLLTLALTAPAAHAAPLERLTLGVASGLRVGDPYTVSEPVELTVTTFVLPWLAVQGRVGASIYHGYYFLPDGFTGILSGDVRFGGEAGLYGAVGAQVFFPPPDESVAEDPAVTYGLRAGWRFHAGDAVRISPELQLGVFYGGIGVHVELPVLRG